MVDIDKILERETAWSRPSNKYASAIDVISRTLTTTKAFLPLREVGCGNSWCGRHVSNSMDWLRRVDALEGCRVGIHLAAHCACKQGCEGPEEGCLHLCHNNHQRRAFVKHFYALFRFLRCSAGALACLFCVVCLVSVCGGDAVDILSGSSWPPSYHSWCSYRG